GQELRLSDFAGPAAAHLGGTHVAAIDDAQGVHELGCEERRAAAIVGERRERADDGIAVRDVGSEVRFEAPDGYDDLARHAEIALDAAEQRAMSRKARAGTFDKRGADTARIELLERELE